MIAHILWMGFVVLCIFTNGLFVRTYLVHARFGVSTVATWTLIYLLLALFSLLGHGRAHDVAYFTALAIWLVALWLGNFGGGDWLRRKGAALRSSLTAIGEAAFRRDVRATG